MSQRLEQQSGAARFTERETHGLLGDSVFFGQKGEVFFSFCAGACVCERVPRKGELLGRIRVLHEEKAACAEDGEGRREGERYFLACGLPIRVGAGPTFAHLGFAQSWLLLCINER